MDICQTKSLFALFCQQTPSSFSSSKTFSKNYIFATSLDNSITIRSVLFIASREEMRSYGAEKLESKLEERKNRFARYLLIPIIPSGKMGITLVRKAILFHKQQQQHSSLVQLAKIFLWNYCKFYLIPTLPWKIFWKGVRGERWSEVARHEFELEFGTP